MYNVALGFAGKNSEFEKHLLTAVSGLKVAMIYFETLLRKWNCIIGKHLRKRTKM